MSSSAAAWQQPPTPEQDGYDASLMPSAALTSSIQDTRKLPSSQNHDHILRHPEHSIENYFDLPSAMLQDSCLPQGAEVAVGTGDSLLTPPPVALPLPGDILPSPTKTRPQLQLPSFKSLGISSTRPDSLLTPPDEPTPYDLIPSPPNRPEISTNISFQRITTIMASPDHVSGTAGVKGSISTSSEDIPTPTQPKVSTSAAESTATGTGALPSIPPVLNEELEIPEWLRPPLEPLRKQASHYQRKVVLISSSCSHLPRREYKRYQCPITYPTITFIRGGYTILICVCTCHECSSAEDWVIIRSVH